MYLTYDPSSVLTRPITVAVGSLKSCDLGIKGSRILCDHHHIQWACSEAEVLLSQAMRKQCHRILRGVLL